MTTQLDRTTQSLREEVLYGQYGDGDKLKEQALAGSLGVSRTVVRLALGALEKEGLVIREPNKGYRVRSFTLAEVTDAIIVRGELEGMAARLCAEQGLNEVQLDLMRGQLLQLDMLLAGGVDTLAARTGWIDLNAAFHEAIIEASANTAIRSTVDTLARMPLVSSRAIVFDVRDPQQNLARLYGAQRDHRKVVDAIAARQGGRAEFLMREHARKSAANKQLSFDALRGVTQTPALPGLALVKG